MECLHSALSQPLCGLKAWLELKLKVCWSRCVSLQSSPALRCTGSSESSLLEKWVPPATGVDGQLPGSSNAHSLP